MLSELRTRLAALADTCEGLELVEARPSQSNRTEGVELRPSGGEPVLVGWKEPDLEVEFAGWSERFTLGDDEDPEADDEALALALDFAMAACFGDLRVIERRRDTQTRQRQLDVRVDGAWRRHGSRGARGLAGLLGLLDTRVHVNALPRPPALRDKLPTGLPSAPWAGAGGFAWVAPLDQPAALVIDGELDLHDFPPREVGALVREYIEQCQARGIHDLRIVHGKGKGVLRRTVHHLLAEHPAVESYRLGGHGEGSWGATIVRLKAP